jgi:hypothetical protein
MRQPSLLRCCFAKGGGCHSAKVAAGMHTGKKPLPKDTTPASNSARPPISPTLPLASTVDQRRRNRCESVDPEEKHQERGAELASSQLLTSPPRSARWCLVAPANYSRICSSTLFKGARLLRSPSSFDQRSEEAIQRRPKNTQIWLPRSGRSLQTVGKEPNLLLKEDLV